MKNVLSILTLLLIASLIPFVAFADNVEKKSEKAKTEGKQKKETCDDESKCDSKAKEECDSKKKEECSNDNEGETSGAMCKPKNKKSKK